MRALYAGVVVLLSAASTSPAWAGNKDFVVQFDNCAEYVGIGLVPAERVRPLVPNQYALALSGSNAQLVVRVVNCVNVSVDGKKSGPARTAQIGVTLASTADPNFQIDNYLLWFVTNSGKLHGKLEAAGIKNGNDQQLQFVFDPISEDGGTLTIDVDAPRFPSFPLFGNASYPSSPPQEYLANWYADSKQGTLLMQTSFHQLRFGKAELVLTPTPDSELADLIGSTSLEFTGLNSYNEWSTATMQATLR
jgi:hypothetical protein